jgi:hypothetical protein
MKLEDKKYYAKLLLMFGAGQVTMLIIAIAILNWLMKGSL